MGPSEAARQNAQAAFFVLRHCPFCTGRGDKDDRACLRCDGTGDLLGALLLRSYDAGVQDASARLHNICDEFQGIIRQTEAMALDESARENIRRRVRQVRSRAGAAEYGDGDDKDT